MDATPLLSPPSASRGRPPAPCKKDMKSAKSAPAEHGASADLLRQHGHPRPSPSGGSAHVAPSPLDPLGAPHLQASGVVAPPVRSESASVPQGAELEDAEQPRSSGDLPPSLRSPAKRAWSSVKPASAGQGIVCSSSLMEVAAQAASQSIGGALTRLQHSPEAAVLRKVAEPANGAGGHEGGARDLPLCSPNYVYTLCDKLISMRRWTT